jgi:hypothetical protein
VFVTKACDTAAAVGRMGQTLAGLCKQLDDQKQEMTSMQAQLAQLQFELATAKSITAACEAEFWSCSSKLLCLGKPSWGRNETRLR